MPDIVILSFQFFSIIYITDIFTSFHSHEALSTMLTSQKYVITAPIPPTSALETKKGNLSLFLP